MEALIERAADNLFSIIILVAWNISLQRDRSAILAKCERYVEKLIDRWDVEPRP